MNYLDFIILAGLLYAAWRGFKKGFIIELFTFLALFIGLYAGIRFSDFLTEVFREKFDWTSEYVPALSFTLIFLGVGAMIYFGGKALEKVVKIVQLSLVNKLLGILFSMLKAVFLIGAGILLLDSYDQDKKGIWADARSGSLFYGPIKTIVTTGIPAFESSAIYMKDTFLEEAGKLKIEEALEKGFSKE